MLEPAISYAANGYPLVERASATIQTVEQLFRKHWTTSAAVYLPNGEVPRPGTIFTNRRLSETYARTCLGALQAGDRVVTSGLTGTFPRGLAIGGLTQVEKSEGDLFQSAEIEPEVDLSKLDEVLIITAPYEDADSAQKLLQEIRGDRKKP